MAKVQTIKTGPDRFDLAQAMFAVADEPIVSFFLKDGTRYDFSIESAVRIRGGRVTLRGRAGIWVSVPSGYGESHRGALQRAEVTYDIMARAGSLTIKL